MEFGNDDIEAAVRLRRTLHQRPDLSGEERETARTICDFLAMASPDQIVEGLGGHGVASVFAGLDPGPTLLLRAELDALPIEEASSLPYRSHRSGKAHLCGHDGHAAILCLVALHLKDHRPARGRVVLLFQPAEETGEGAARVIADPKFQPLRPDRSFALHNMPGLPLGFGAIRAGAVNCASRGLRIRLGGSTAHASTPWTGRSPVAAAIDLMQALPSLGRRGPLDETYRFATLTHVRIGEPTFGVSPGEAELLVTLRTMLDAGMDDLCQQAERMVQERASAENLAASWSYEDIFRHCLNHGDCVGAFRSAMSSIGMAQGPGEPIHASEDFGLFGDLGPSAMMFLGAGVDRPALHDPAYEFPEELIPTGAGVFSRIVRDALG
ncbi:amidohydrolase [Aureimonas sp. ME7]|uniref:amidohydrolase n=1 Tax=Aureimonas sp. ME7 TaxID=2744252 RepID=UPI0015F60FBE|nr:amidohydrolase [Aureimonas sp. ME7]